MGQNETADLVILPLSAQGRISRTNGASLFQIQNIMNYDSMQRDSWHAEKDTYDNY